MGATPLLAHTRCDYGALLLARGRPGDEERGRALVEAALEVGRESGMTRLVAKAEVILATETVWVASSP